MGRLLSGHYGQPPEAESARLSLRECNQKLGLKPGDFVSEGPPKFFQKSFGTRSRYLLFQTDPEETAGSAVWKAGYYLLPLEAADVLQALDGKNHAGAGGVLPTRIEVKSDEPPPARVLERAQQWAKQSQPLFFRCGCEWLELRLDPPWALRRRWRARLRCPKRCQPALTVQL